MDTEDWRRSLSKGSGGYGKISISQQKPLWIQHSQGFFHISVDTLKHPPGVPEDSRGVRKRSTPVCLPGRWVFKKPEVYHPMSNSKRTFRIDEWIAAILLFSMATIAFVNVLSRYFFHFSFAATEEITINFFVWLTLVGSGIAFERGGQLGMVTLYKIFPNTFKKFVIILSAFLSAILFLLVDIIMIQTIYAEMTLFHSTSAALGIPIITYYIGVPILSVFVFIGIYRGASSKFKDIDTRGI